LLYEKAGAGFWVLGLAHLTFSLFVVADKSAMYVLY
jgi:hypothetical protein